MPTKIRLQRHGRKGYAFFHIVVADSRAPRDGKNIEKLGVYNPNTDPATIEVNVDSTLKWLENGAQPTDTCRAILSYKGVMYKKHLQGGVKKGAFSQEEADKRYEKWMADKADKVQKGADVIAKAKSDVKAKAFDAEVVVKEAIATKIAAKTSALAAEVEAANAPAVEEEEVAAPDVLAEAAAELSSQPATASTEEAPTEVEAAVEAPKAEEPVVEKEAAPEAKAEEVVEAEAKEEPVAEVKAESEAEAPEVKEAAPEAKVDEP
ncbi:MAG: 30S ribosomal protein S16, partial [Flavobacteriales bacterium]|nr:30S ribosomal protein S16 [Flavobacteriales bacterium]